MKSTCWFFSISSQTPLSLTRKRTLACTTCTPLSPRIPPNVVQRWNQSASSEALAQRLEIAPKTCLNFSRCSSLAWRTCKFENSFLLAVSSSLLLRFPSNRHTCKYICLSVCSLSLSHTHTHTYTPFSSVIEIAGYSFHIRIGKVLVGTSYSPLRV